MVSHNMLAQYWIGMRREVGHISYFKRVDLDALMRLSTGDQHADEHTEI